jgi:acylphosphatase
VTDSPRSGDDAGPREGRRDGFRDAPAAAVRLTAWVRGRVQGVGFRWWTRATALEIGSLVGFASNREDGRVQVVAEGPREHCERLLEWLRHGATPGRVDGVTEIWGPARGGYRDFGMR